MPGDGAIQKSVIKERLIDRLQAMSATNRAITDSMGGGVRLLDLIDSAIHGFESRFDITGSPGLALGPQMTQNFSLGLHELLTNALKYGALSVPEGRLGLQLDWTSFVLTFVWQERGGRPAAAGFGSRILGDFAKSFCENVQTSYAPGCFRYSLQNPVRPKQIGRTKPRIDHNFGFRCRRNRQAQGGRVLRRRAPRRRRATQTSRAARLVALSNGQGRALAAVNLPERGRTSRANNRRPSPLPIPSPAPSRHRNRSRLFCA